MSKQRILIIHQNIPGQFRRIAAHVFLWKVSAGAARAGQDKVSTHHEKVNRA